MPRTSNSATRSMKRKSAGTDFMTWIAASHCPLATSSAKRTRVARDTPTSTMRSRRSESVAAASCATATRRAMTTSVSSLLTAA